MSIGFNSNDKGMQISEAPTGRNTLRMGVSSTHAKKNPKDRTAT